MGYRETNSLYVVGYILRNDVFVGVRSSPRRGTESE